jgi:hypothetical protein
MPQQIINIGIAASDGTGDSVRVGGQKINANFTELYALVAQKSSQVVTNQLVNGSQLATLNSDGTFNVNGLVDYTGLSISTNASGASRWNFNTDGSLSFPDSTAQITAYLGTATTTRVGGVKPDGTSILISNGIISTGPITANLSFYTNAMYSTTGVLVKNGQTTSTAGLVIPPAAGGPFQINNSSDYVQIMSNQNTWKFGTDGSLTFPDTSVQTTAYTATVAKNLFSVTTNSASGGGSLTYGNGVFTFTPAVVYSLPTATTTVLGGVKVDGTTITINNGVISGANTYSLPTATTSVLGGVKVDGTSITISNGVISVGASLTGTITFKGTWNASTNTPTLVNGTGTLGWQYIVSVGGTRNLGAGSVTYNPGDLVIYDGSKWVNVASNTGVLSFNTRTGNVTLTSSDVTTALGYTPLQTTGLSVSTTTASGGGSLTYAAGSFTFAPASIPTYTVTTNSASGGGSLSITGTVLTFTPAVQYSLPTATTSVLGGVKVDNNTIVITNGVISVGSALTSATIFKGAWNASTNTPTLASGTGTIGNEYIVSVGGTRNIGNGTKTYNVGDLVIYDGTNWAQITGTNAVQSFNTRQGIITLTSLDVTTALGYTPLQSTSLSITSNAASGSTSTLSYASGVFTFTPASSASVLSGLSVASSNGFSGSVTSSALTIQTSVTGLLKGNGTAILPAVSGTDYQAPISATGILKSNGVSGNVAVAVADTDYIAPYGSTTKNYVLASPTGADGVPTFRRLTASDLPYAVAGTSVTGARGGVIPDGTTITITSGVISVGSLSSLTVSGISLIGSQANTTRFPNAKVIISDVSTGQQNESGNIGIIGEVLATGATRNAGVYGVGYSSGTFSAQGVIGEGHVIATSDTAPSVGVRGYANDTHAGGSNVGLYGDATNGLNNYSLYLNNGDIYSSGAKTWYLNGNLTFNGAYTISATAATATTSSTAASLGYIGTPINTQASTYTLVIGDAGKTIYAGGNLTIPANGTVAFPVGTIINVIASSAITVAITTDTLQWGGQATSQTGTRSIAIYGMASLVKVANTVWYISGVGVT